jgi:hypothetical protein
MKHTRYIILAIVCFVVALLALGVYGAYKIVRELTPAEVLQSETARNFIRDNLPEDKKVFFDLLPDLLGLETPKTYLILFQNNTELRPTGGFIGSFGVVRVHKGSFELLSVQGTEQLDWRSLPSTAQKPPQPILEYLDVPYWYSRDANWSPDFRVAVPDILRLYNQEKGPYADEIDMVVAITASVLQDVLADIGPLVVEGKTFTAENAVDVLQYDTSYGYADRDIPWQDRKRIIDLLSTEIIRRISDDPIGIAPKLVSTLSTRAREGHVMLYSTDEVLQAQFEAQQVAGRVLPSKGDALLWVDANLAALKTDQAIERALTYTLRQDTKTKEWISTATMQYVHTKDFDWKTTRYLTYARVFVPEGAQIKRVYTTLNGGKQTDVDMKNVSGGVELGKQWFGYYYSLEPKQTGTVTFEYVLPKDAVQKPYELFVQKQLGTEAHGLTLDLQFDTKVQTATPGETKDKWGDARYQYSTDLRVNREIQVGF